MKPILIIKPHDKTTSFLERIKNYIINEFTDDTHYFNVRPNDQSHNQCHDRIKEHPDDGIIIFLGHGRSDRLFGSRGDRYETIDFVSPEAIEEEPESYYFNDNFIGIECMDLFKNKKIFCLACRSNEVATLAVESGAKSFIGFGDIPTSVAEFQNKGINATSEMVATMKAEINQIVKSALVYCLKRNMSFEALLDTIVYLTNKRIADILVHYKWFKERHILVDHLYFFKKEACVLGDKRASLLP